VAARRAWIAALASFAAACALLALLRPRACLALYLGTLIYGALAPAALLVRWRLGRGLPLALLAYLASLLAAGALALLPPVRADYAELQRAQARLIGLALGCPLGAPLMALHALVLAPVVEEAIFRGVVFEAARRRLGTAAAYAVSSAAFALAHRAGPGAVPLAAISLSLAFAYHRCGLAASALLHSLHNALSLLLFLLLG
jgi:membrane protease YdiL (CAAX protease family)